MVKIYFTTKNPLELEVTGHAQAAEKGKDLICCAISMLTQTLSIYMKKLNELGLANLLKNDVEEGHAHIVALDNNWSKEARTAFAVIGVGLRELAEEYKQYIEIEEE